MAAIKVADLFASIGMRVDVKQLNMFQKRLAGIKKQLLDLKRLSAARLSPNTNLAGVNALNAALTRTLALRRSIAATPSGGVGGGGVVPGGGGSRGGGGGRGARPAGGGFFGGAAAASAGVRGGFVQRNFLGGFTAVIAVKKLFQATAAMQGIEVALGAVTREGETTAQVMGFLRSESNRLGFEFQTSALEYAKLAAAGNSVNLQQKTIKETFIAAQEAARVFNLSVSDTEGVLKAFTQIISKGKITAEELRNQLGDRLPGAVGIFANAIGVSTQELSKMLEQGEVMADDDTLQKVAAELRRTVADQVVAASNNATAAMNRFRNSLLEFGASIGKSGLADVFRILLDGARQVLNILAPVFAFIARALRTLLVPLQAFGRIVTRFTDMFPNFTTVVIALALGIWALTAANNAAILSFLKWFRIFAVVGAVLLLVDDLATALEGGDSIIGRMVESSNIFFSVIGRVLMIFGEIVVFAANIAAAIFSWSFDGLTESLDRLIEKLRELTGLNAASGILTDLFERIDIGGNFEDAAGGPSIQSPRAFINSEQFQVMVEVTGDTEVIAGVVAEVNDGALRQAQAEQGNNE